MTLSIYKNIYRQVFRKKLNSPLGAVLLCLFAIALSAVMVKYDYKLGPILIMLLIGVILFLSCIAFPLFGFYITSFISCFAFYPGRMMDTFLPITAGIEFLILAVYLGLLLQNRHSPPQRLSPFYRTPISIATMFYFVFVLIEGFNPNMYSLLG